MNFKIILSIIFLVLACSCSSSARSSRRFEVTVSENGKKVSDLSKQLVHRIGFSASELEDIFGTNSSEMEQSLSLRTQLDHLRRVTGLEVSGEGRKLTDEARELGLMNGDLVTAVGLSRVKNTVDFWQMYESLKKQGSATITLQRQGDAHKILYFLKR